MSSELVYNIITTDHCNLKCQYCYVNSINNPLIMTREVVDAMTCRAKSLLGDMSFEKIIFVLFGGEPLLVWDEITKYLMDELIRLESEFPGRVEIPVTTNGTIFTDEMAEYLKYPFIGYNVSVDWSEDSHNTTRPFKNDFSSYRSVLRSISLIKKIRGTVPLKATISPANIKYLPQVINWLESVELKELSLSIVRDNIWEDQDALDFKKYLSELADIYKNRIDDGFILDIFHRGIVFDGESVRNSYPCSAGKDSFSISSHGDIYPCQRFYNNKKYLLGNIVTGVEHKKNINLFQKYNLSNMIKCNHCSYFEDTCSVGCCIAANEEYNQNLFQPIDNVCKILSITNRISNQLHDSLRESDKYQEIMRRYHV